MIYMSFFIGLILICKGGDWFVDAASKLSEILGIPKYVIGATIVSFATTMPEIIVSVAAALDGHSAMAIGNAVGSVSANTGIILALSLFFLPVAIKREEYLFKNSLYIGTLLLLLISFKDRIFDRADCLLLYSRRQSALSNILSLKLINNNSNVPIYKLFLNKYSSLLIATGRKNKLSARIIPVFAETEPTAFPIAMAECPSNAAATETMISGIVVAKLTIVAPITYFGIPSISDNFDAASTNQSPPLQIRISPIKKDI